VEGGVLSLAGGRLGNVGSPPSARGKRGGQTSTKKLRQGKKIAGSGADQPPEKKKKTSIRTGPQLGGESSTLV